VRSGQCAVRSAQWAVVGSGVGSELGLIGKGSERGWRGGDRLLQLALALHDLCRLSLPPRYLRCIELVLTSRS
jgi:hypothetical protein